MLVTLTDARFRPFRVIVIEPSRNKIGRFENPMKTRRAETIICRMFNNGFGPSGFPVCFWLAAGEGWIYPGLGKIEPLLANQMLTVHHILTD